MDVLADVLSSIHVKALVSGRLELSAPWGFRMEGGRSGFYVVTRGSCWLQVDGVPAPLQLSGGDFVLLPQGHAHALRDSQETRALPVSQIIRACPKAQGCQPGGVFQNGGDGPVTTVVGGCFQFEDGHLTPLASALPAIIHVKGDGGSPVKWLDATLQFVASEMASGQPGAEIVVNRLADILLVQAVRTHLAQVGQQGTGWLRAIVDPQIGEALSLIHQKLEEPWTVESLAGRVAMSRSAFAARFAELVEEPPLTYLTRWRMHRAARLLRASEANVGEIASRVGYEAQAAFNKAFKRWIGVAPGVYRRARLTGAPTGVGGGLQPAAHPRA